MSRRPRLQSVRRSFHGRCLVCDERDPALLDCHRAFDPGGRYTWGGTMTLCANCHRKAHEGRVMVHGRHLTSYGYYVFHCTVDGEERWIPDTREV